MRSFLVLAAASLLSVMAPAQVTDGTGPLTGIIIYQATQAGVPFSFSHHDVTYSNIGQRNVLNPTGYDVEVVKPSTYPYTRSLLIPDHIRVGVYDFEVTQIAGSAFQQTGIRGLEVKAEIRTIPHNCFMYCTDLETVRFHGSYPHFIEAAAFQGCSALKSINLPAQLKYIGNNAFSQCGSLKEITIPKDVATLGDFAFYRCMALEKVTFLSGHFRTIPPYCFQTCEALREVEIPNGVATLAEYCFNGAGLEVIWLPASLRRIEGNALTQTRIKKIYCRAMTPPWVGPNFTYDQTHAIELHVPAAALAAYKADSFWSNFTNIVGDM